jgi:hypothetical protein
VVDLTNMGQALTTGKQGRQGNMPGVSVLPMQTVSTAYPPKQTNLVMQLTLTSNLLTACVVATAVFG